ncbi:hypothetical protein ACRARH_16480 [Phytobacter ursingii]
MISGTAATHGLCTDCPDHVIFLINVYTLIVPFIWAIFAYLRLFIKFWAISTKPYVMFEIFQDSPLDKFLFNASVSKNKNEAIVMLTMQDRKVYVGNVIKMGEPKEGANKQVISSQADSLIKISRIWADFFPANTSNQPI